MGSSLISAGGSKEFQDGNHLINSFRRQLGNFLLNLPLIDWVLFGFLFTFIALFVVPVYLNPASTMKFYQYIPVLSPIGHDFRDIVSSSYTWFHFGTVPTTLYPPFTLIFFAPFTWLSYEVGYKILAGLILACYLFTTWILPRRMNNHTNTSAFALLIAVTGILSYGFQFELERGQWNLIAFSFCLASIYLFHKQPKYRWLAYLLFTLSVQLKLFPAIFVLTLIDDLSDWKSNLRRIFALGGINILALFILGPDPIFKTVMSLNRFSPGASSHFNHSLVSFTLFLFSKGVLPQKRLVLWLTANEWLPELLLFALFGSCFLIILSREFKRKATGFSPYIFLACFIGACIIPSISFDYKLSMLPACIAISIPEILLSEDGRQRPLVVILAFVFSAAYSFMLFSYINKPRILENDFPELLLILIISTILSVMRSSGIAPLPAVDSKT